MADETEFEFQEAITGGALTYPVLCSALRKNGFVVLQGRPCKIVELEKGAADVYLCGIDIFTSRKLEETVPLGSIIDVPNVRRRDYQLIDVDDSGFVSLMDDAGELRSDLKIPDNEQGSEIRRGFEDGKELICTVLDALGEEAIIAFKIASY